MLVISSLGGGGAEKVLADLINFLDKRKYDVSLVLFEKKGVNLASVENNAVIYDLKKDSRYSLPWLIIRLALLFHRIKPDTVISFMSYANILSILSRAVAFTRIKLIITEHSYLSVSLSCVSFGKVKTFLYKSLYGFADICIVPSEGVAEDLNRMFNLKEEYIKTIPNPVNLELIDKRKNEDADNGKYILSVGRLAPEKGYAHLIKAYFLICDQVEEKLVILGAGLLESSLRALARSLGVEERVLFLGYQPNPYKFMRKASIFVLSSIWESFALVVVEAMACGVPVIAADCPSGPGEIITNGVNGILVPPSDENALAKAMLELIRSDELRKKISQAGRMRSEDFDISKVLPRYEKLF